MVKPHGSRHQPTTQPNRPAATAPPVARSAAQRRAAYALDRIRSLENVPSGNYRAYVRGLPALIVSNGLGQALALELAGANRDKGHAHLFKHVANWLLGRAPDGLEGWSASPYGSQDPILDAERPDILGAIARYDEAAYLCAQEEAMALLAWLKIFAEAYLDKPQKEAGR